MELKARLLDESGMMRALKRISHEIIERNDGADNIVLVGIKSRGVPIARIIADNIFYAEGKRVSVEELDIGLYRDDLSEKYSEATVQSHSEFEARGKIIVLVDDVLYTGRTARAAMEAVIKMGRPALIQLAVLVDRGHRELPIRADYVGKNVPTSRTETVKVHLSPVDEQTEIALYEM